MLGQIALLGPLADAVCAGDFASRVISYSMGTNPANGFTNPLVALGPPERMTGEGIDPGATTPFQPCFLSSEVVSIGAGGALTLGFNPPLRDHAGNPFGIDFLIFGNSFFTDGAYPSGVVSGLASDGGTVQVTQDGATWLTIPMVLADGLFPTMGYVDCEPYSNTAGLTATNPHMPVDPALGMSAIAGVSYEELVALYDGAAGGAGVDLASVGIAQAVAIRIVVGNGVVANVEIDAVSRVNPLTHPADIDGNGAVDGADLAAVLSAFGSASSSADIDRSGTVDGPDLTAVLAGWSN